jgi:hypothetical protein
MSEAAFCLSHERPPKSRETRISLGRAASRPDSLTRSLWCRRDPILQRDKQLTDVFAVDTLTYLSGTTPAVISNGRERRRATGQKNVNGLVPQRLCYFRWLYLAEITASHDLRFRGTRLVDTLRTLLR